uniref:Putative portal protein n=1 Tax=viral metagenome TaxID=1070528 RepID=A0A6M3XMF3_9ZZZZ
MPKINISDEKIIEIVRPLLEKAINWNEQKSVERMKAADLYHMKKFGNERSGWSEEVASTVFDTVEWSKPDLTAIFTHPDFFSIKMSDSKRAEMIKKVVRYQMFRKQKGAKEIRAWIHDTLLYHNGTMKTYYMVDYDLKKETFERLTIDQMDQITQDENISILQATEVEEVVPGQINPQMYQGNSFGGSGGTGVMGGGGAGYQPEVLQMQTETSFENVKVVKKVIKYAGPCVKCCPQWEFLILPAQKDEEKSPLIGQMFRLTLDEVRKRELLGEYRKGSYDKLKEHLEALGSKSIEIESEIESQFTTDNLDYTTNETGSIDNTTDGPLLSANEFWAYELYLRLDIDGDKLLEPVILTMSVGDTVLNLVENPYEKPVFCSSAIYEIAHRFEGKCLPLVLESDQKELTNLQRIYTDSAADSAYGTIITGSKTLQENWNTRKPGDVVIMVDFNPEQFQELRPAPPSDSLLDIMDKKQQNAERKVGVNSLNQGINEEDVKTATGTALLQRAGQKMQSFRARVLGDVPEEIIRQFIRINQMNPPKGMVLPDGTQIPDDLFNVDEDFDIEIDVGLSPNSQAIQAQSLMQHQQWVMNFGIPNGACGIEHAIKTQKKIGRLLDVAFDELMYSEEEINTVNQLKQQLQQLQQQAQQMGMQMQPMQQRLGQQQEEIIELGEKNAGYKNLITRASRRAIEEDQAGRGGQGTDDSGRVFPRALGQT